MKVLNLGCGTKTSSNPEFVNIDWALYLRIRNNRLGRAIIPHLIKGDRLDRFNSLPDNIMVHNLSKGIPFDSDSVDVVYHSHFLEHLDRDIAEKFLIEVKRVLKPGGIQRIVVPDFEKVCKAYVSHISICENNSDEANIHDSYIAAIIQQSVIREAHGTSQQKPFSRFLENTFVGDARRSGETHQWMYDKINLKVILNRLGYRDFRLLNFTTSNIPNWNSYGLDFDENGGEYKPESMYIEVKNNYAI